MHKNKIIYWLSTVIVTIILLFSIWLYLFNHQTAVNFFKHLGYPAYLVYPLAIAKIFGLIAILSRQSKFLKNLAYAGFFYDFILALSAHLVAGDGGFVLALIAFITLIISFSYERKLIVASTR